MEKLRSLVAKLEDGVQDQPEFASVALPLLTEIVHELANMETMVGAIERRLEKLESGERR
jgi:hypothetical protein